MIADERIDHFAGELWIVADAFQQPCFVERRVGFDQDRRRHTVRPFLDHREQRRRVDWLRQVAVHAMREAALAIAGHGVRGHRDNSARACR